MNLDVKNSYNGHETNDEFGGSRWDFIVDFQLGKFGSEL